MSLLLLLLLPAFHALAVLKTPFELHTSYNEMRICHT
jgi:hypothetical protein